VLVVAGNVVQEVVGPFRRHHDTTSPVVAVGVRCVGAVLGVGGGSRQAQRVGCIWGAQNQNQNGEPGRRERTKPRYNQALYRTSGSVNPEKAKARSCSAGAAAEGELGRTGAQRRVATRWRV